MSNFTNRPVSVKRKVCRWCGEDKDASLFYRFHRSSDGLHAHCKKCTDERRKFQRQYGKKRRWGLGIFRHCGNCDLWKVKGDFYSHKAQAFQGWCKDCVKANRKVHYAENKNEILASEKKARRLFRQDMIAAYGGCCQCCGETRWEFLTIDHIGGGGCEHRRRLGGSNREIYRELKKQGWPKDKYRLLCYNCNCCLGSLGYCPHQRDINE